MTASSASQFKEPGLKKNVSVYSKLASKIKMQKRDDDYIKYEFFIPEVKNWAMSHLLNGCFAVLNMATSSCLIQSCGVIY